MKQRDIIHVDMDCFYASIEMRDEPKLQDKPVVIARDPRKTGGHGVVATANYQARAFGIHSAMNAQQAIKLCPKAVFVTPDFEKYRRISRKKRRYLILEDDHVRRNERYMQILPWC